MTFSRKVRLFLKSMTFLKKDDFSLKCKTLPKKVRVLVEK
jgi:hypothetical protein